MIKGSKGALLIHIIKADIFHLYFILSMYGFFLYAHFLNSFILLILSSF